MFKNSYKIVFFLSMMMGTLISISSSSWLGMWMGLEINLLSFIPLMMSTKNLFSSESSLKYFLTQALASSLFIFSLMIMFFMINKNFYLNNYVNLIICSSMLMKSGAAPFHFWFPSVMEGLSWNSSLILMTWQKLAPLMILSFCMSLTLLTYSIILSIVFGSLGGLNQTSLRKLMAFSSINHLGWMISGMLYNEILWMTYLSFYIFLTLNIVFLFNNFKLLNINQTFSMFNNNSLIKVFLFIVLLSLGGLPPFLGFFPKWMIMETLTIMKMMIMLIIMMFFTLITLFFYLRISYSAFLINNLKMNWNFNNNMEFKNYKFTMVMNYTSMLGLLLLMMFFLII